MKIVLAPDSFKENMTAREAAEAMERGVRDVLPEAQCVLRPMSDGGEGFIDAVAGAWGAELITAQTVDALGRRREARYALAGARAVMDVACCAGLELIDPRERDVMRSSTAGLGLLIADAVTRGSRTILIGIGGSATNDAGMGMLVELGARLTDAEGREVPPRPSELGRVTSIDTTALARSLNGVRIRVACDVTNPLTGPSGATAVFGPQKGVGAGDVERLDEALAHLARVSGHEAEAHEPGSGAAGGLGWALRAFLGAVLEPGVALVAEAVGLADCVQGADLVMTGEGSVDEQTLAGKTPAGVAAIAAARAAPCVVFAGRIEPGADALLDHGVTQIVKVGPPEEPVAQALRNGRVNMRRAVKDYLGDHLGRRAR